MEIFTDVERRILEATDKRYKWIARDEIGCLYIYNTKPYRDRRVFDTDCGHFHFACDKCFADILFKNVTWENSPIQYRDSELLTPKEREYLKLVFKPFASNTLYIQKAQLSDSMEYIRAVTHSSTMVLPDFKKGTMYEGMKLKTMYTLKELGIIYNE